MCVRLKNRNLALLMALIMSASTFLAGCGEEEVAEPDPSIVVETVKPGSETIELDGDFMGTVEADNTVTVTAKASGDVTGTFFEVGDTVNAGDLLFTLDDRAAQIGMTTAKVAADNAAIAVDNANASKSAAEYGMLYTEATIREKVGTMDTDEMRLLNAVTQTKLALKTAEETAELAKEQYGLAADQYDELEDRIDDLQEDYDHMNRYYKELVAIKENATRVGNMSADDAKSYIQNTLGISNSKLDINSETDEREIEKKYIRYMTGNSASTETDLRALVASAQAARSSVSASQDASSSSKDSLRISRFSAAISKETA
ncbi:MAG: biotin/lipoyl-binding protein, partial [Lachnospiraceae bacterium]|nr:biotin/lipoyl-binding protein [Lachnospiraceae bacterium]